MDNHAQMDQGTQQALAARLIQSTTLMDVFVQSLAESELDIFALL